MYSIYKAKRLKKLKCLNQTFSAVCHHLTFFIEFFEHVQFICVARFKIVIFRGNFPLFHARGFRDSRLPSFLISSQRHSRSRCTSYVPRDLWDVTREIEVREYPGEAFRFRRRTEFSFSFGVVLTPLTVVRN